MIKLSQVGPALMCLCLLAPAAARADSVSVLSAAYEGSFVQAAIDHEQASTVTSRSIFSWCRRCAAADASPFLVSSANLSAFPQSNHDQGFNIVFNGGFSATFGGVMTLPVPALSSATTQGSNTPTITLPIAPSSGDDDHHGNGNAANSNNGSVITPGVTGKLHGTEQQIARVAGGVTSTGRAALTKAESLAATPEPATLLLLGAGLMGIASTRAFKRHA